jgi:hypothetical protein
MSAVIFENGDLQPPFLPALDWGRYRLLVVLVALAACLRVLFAGAAPGITLALLTAWTPALATILTVALADFAARLACFFRGELVRFAAFMRRFATLTGHFAPALRIHAGKTATRAFAAAFTLIALIFRCHVCFSLERKTGPTPC